MRRQHHALFVRRREAFMAAAAALHGEGAPRKQQRRVAARDSRQKLAPRNKRCSAANSGAARFRCGEEGSSQRSAG